jgi:hypothetical protein
MNSPPTSSHRIHGKALWHSLIADWRVKRLNVHVHITTTKPLCHLVTGQYCALLESALASVDLRSSNFHAPRKSNRDHAVRRPDHGHSNAAMLVPVAKVTQLPKHLGARPLPAVVRLQPLNSCPYAAWNSWQSPIGLSPEIAPLTHNRELDRLLFLRIGWLGKSERQMVERAAKVMRRIANQEGHLGRVGFDFLHPDCQPPFTVLIGHEYVELRLEESIADCFSRFEVLLCPSQLLPDGTQVGHNQGGAWSTSSIKFRFDEDRHTSTASPRPVSGQRRRVKERSE